MGVSFLVSGSPAAADVPDPCASYSWDVSQERALFAAQAVTLQTGNDAKLAPTLMANRLYALKLAPQPSVSFMVPPSKKVPIAGGFAGVFVLQVSASGVYRISGDSAFWVDVIAAGKLLETKDYQRQKGCNSPHKILEFELPAGVPILLELSSASSADVRVSITAAPLPKA